MFPMKYTNQKRFQCRRNFSFPVGLLVKDKPPADSVFSRSTLVLGSLVSNGPRLAPSTRSRSFLGIFVAVRHESDRKKIENRR